MTKVTIQSAGTANPPLYMPQAQAFESLCALFSLTEKERALYETLMVRGPIRGRYLGMDAPEEAADTDQDRLIARFTKFARSTARAAAQQALDRAALSAADVDVLVVNTCTGYLCPGLTSYLVEDLGLRDNVRTLDVMGMGCGSAIPNMQAASGLLQWNDNQTALCVAVEMCTATLFMDPDPGVIVSNAIFGDGAAALVLQRGATRPGPAIVDVESLVQPEHREMLRYRTEQHRLRNVLSPRVPALGAEAAERVIDRLLQRHDLARDAVSHWIVHPGGTQVLSRFGKKLGLTAQALRHSYAVFEEYGNMSSPSVWFVWDRLLREDAPSPGAWGVMLSFGAGFSAFGTLIRF